MSWRRRFVVNQIISKTAVDRWAFPPVSLRFLTSKYFRENISATGDRNCRIGSVCSIYEDGRPDVYHAPMFRMPHGAGNPDPPGAGIGAREIPLEMPRMPEEAYQLEQQRTNGRGG